MSTYIIWLHLSIPFFLFPFRIDPNRAHRRDDALGIYATQLHVRLEHLHHGHMTRLFGAQTWHYDHLIESSRGSVFIVQTLHSQLCIRSFSFRSITSNSCSEIRYCHNIILLNCPLLALILRVPYTGSFL
jgi:hypothetical protein